MKSCPRCNTVKPVTEFAKRAAAKDGLQTYCKRCAVEARMESYSKNTERESEYRKVVRQQNRERIQQIKGSNPCVDCGNIFPYYVMDFDHLDGKIYNVSQMLTLSWDTIEQEIKKCELVCANCHRVRTFVRSVS